MIKRLYRFLFTSWVFLVLAGQALCQAQPTDTKLTDLEALCRYRKHDFGEVSIGTDAVHEFEIRNPNAQVLKIKSVSSSCGCAVVSVESKEIKPGDSTKLKVKLETDRFRGERTSSILVRFDKPYETELNFSIKANIRNVKIEPPVVAFFSVPRQSEVRQTLTVQRSGSAYWSIKQIASSAPAIQTKILDKDVRPGFVEYTIECILTGSGGDGFNTAEIVLQTNDSKEPQVIVPVHYNVQASLLASPKQLIFDLSDEDNPRTKKVVIQSAEETELTGLTIQDDRFSAVELNPAKKKLHIVEVTAPQDAGATVAELVIETDNGDSIKIAVSVVTE